MIMGNRTFPERSDVDGCICLSCNKKTGNVLLSQAASRQVSSALRSLTSVFEMGTGVSSLLLSPDLFVFWFLPLNLNKYILLTVSVECHAFGFDILLSYVSVCFAYRQHMTMKTIWSSARPISIGQLNALLHLHLRPIYVVVSHGSYLSEEILSCGGLRT